MATLKYTNSRWGTATPGNWALKKICELLEVEPKDIEVRPLPKTARQMEWNDKVYEVLVKGEIIGEVTGNSWSDHHIIPGTVLRQDHAPTMHWNHHPRHRNTTTRNERMMYEDTRMEAILNLVKAHIRNVESIANEGAA